MQIISHRGYWKAQAEKNSVQAFRRTLACGFGTETDVRDLAGELVVAHDPPRGGETPWREVLAMFHGTGLPLAVNIKADGLAPLLQEAFAQVQVAWFAFDMSGPETVRYAKAGLPFYARHSDVEPEPILYREAAGVWLDDFTGGWISTEAILRHLDAGKAVCVVSPELHGRDPRAVWEELAKFRSEARVTLCTDRPEEARALLKP
jgi:glycerophosphoryl diester phosphodiesterase